MDGRPPSIKDDRYKRPEINGRPQGRPYHQKNLKMQRFITIILAFTVVNLFAQSNIQQSLSINDDGAAAHASAQLDVNATDKGMLVPRLTTAQRTAIASPATGLVVFDTNTANFWFFNGLAWVQITTGTVLTDADGDTKVQVEKNPNEDIIRFDLGGTESMVLRKNPSGHFRLEMPSGSNNCFFGFASGANSSAGNNTSAGYNALNSNTIGNHNTAIGSESLRSNTFGSNNTAIGRRALFNSSGSQNTANGWEALSQNSTGNRNTATGEQALSDNTTGSDNTATGSEALDNNTTGSSNTAYGWRALRYNTTGSSNVAIGTQALEQNTTRSNLVAVGHETLSDNGLGATAPNHAIENTGLGTWALRSNGKGSFNTAAGYGAAQDNTDGTQNTAFGTFAMTNNTTGNNNTAISEFALGNNTTGSSNTAVGPQALEQNLLGSNNTAMGYLADFFHPSLNNTTAIGYSASGINNVDNRIEIGTISNNWIGGQVTWSTYSDARIKTRVQENVPGLAFITKLRPVTYHLDIRKQQEICFHGKKQVVEQDGKYDIEQKRMTGFIAQEVEAAAKAVGYDFSGLDRGAEEGGLYSLRYETFVMPLVKALQEQGPLIEHGESEMEDLEELALALEAENAALKAQLEKIATALVAAGIELK